MKKLIITLVLVILALILGWWLYGVIAQINAPESEIAFEEKQNTSESELTTNVIGVERIQYLARETQQEPVRYDDYVYLGGEWGLLVGNKSNHDFQQYVTENPVRNVMNDNTLLQYEEWNPQTQIWEANTVNLKAYSTFLGE